LQLNCTIDVISGRFYPKRAYEFLLNKSAHSYW